MIKIAAVGVAAVLAAVFLREQAPQFGSCVILGAGLLLFAFGFRKLESVVDSLREVGASVALESRYLEILFKMLGVSYLSEFAASLCKDSGYTSVAGQIQTLGKLTVIAISMPVILSLLELLGELFP